MARDREKVVSLFGGIIHDNHLLAGQLFAPADVIEELPLDECDEVMVIGRTREGRLYIGATHNSSVCSLMIGQASNFLHRALEVYGS